MTPMLASTGGRHNEVGLSLVSEVGALIDLFSDFGSLTLTLGLKDEEPPDCGTDENTRIAKGGARRQLEYPGSIHLSIFLRAHLGRNELTTMKVPYLGIS